MPAPVGTLALLPYPKWGEDARGAGSFIPDGAAVLVIASDPSVSDVAYGTFVASVPTSDLALAAL